MALTTVQQAMVNPNPSTQTFGFKNRLINGGMVIDQRNAGASIIPTASTQFVVDRFIVREDTDGSATCQRSTVAPSGFINSILYTVTGTDTSLSSLQYVDISQRIEGFNTADLNWGTANAQTVTLSFWVRSSVTGTFAAYVGNGASTRAYPATYTISAANTWEQKSITITGDTTGTWVTDNGIGIIVGFTLAAGTTYQGTANTWNASGVISTASATNLMATNGATFYITGVQLESGSTATGFDFRSYGTELALCQRYYQQLNAWFEYSMGAVGNLNSPVVTFSAPMRASPTITAISQAAQNNTLTGYQVHSRNNVFFGYGLIYNSSSTGYGYRQESNALSAEL